MKPRFHGPPWLRGLDLNQRPLGYEPNELPTAPLRDVIVLWVQRYGFLFNMQIKCIIFFSIALAKYLKC